MMAVPVAMASSRLTAVASTEGTEMNTSQAASAVANSSWGRRPRTTVRSSMPAAAAMRRNGSGSPS